MSAYESNKLRLQTPRRPNLIKPVLLIWGAVLLIGSGFIWFAAGLGDSYKRFYLLPWILVTGIVVLAPTVYLLYKGKFDPFHPLVFAAWSYVFPAFVMGGVMIFFNLVDPYFMSFVEDPVNTLPLSLIYVAIGYLGLTIGYAVPLVKYVANRIERRFPNWQWEPSQVWFGGIFLLVVGTGVNVLGLIQGIMGYQRVAEIGNYDAVLYFLLVLLSEGSILLWIGIFGAKQKTRLYYFCLAILLISLPLRMALQGSRGGLVLSVLPIAMAFQYSGRRLKWQHTVAFVAGLMLAVAIGVIYGTSFRNIKGSEARIDAGDYVGQVGATIEYLSTEDPSILIQNSAQALADRVENLSSLAVVVSNYERLAPYEESYGLANNIVNDTFTSLIPRFIWNEKPQVSDARAYSDLYFNYGENSFAISPFGDLLRNFGPIGIPLGMFLVGVYLRLIYAALIDTPNPAIWKRVAYFPLLTVVSYESFYATILPGIFRTLVVLVISLFVTNVIVKTRLSN